MLVLFLHAMCPLIGAPIMLGMRGSARLGNVDGPAVVFSLRESVVSILPEGGCC